MSSAFVGEKLVLVLVLVPRPVHRGGHCGHLLHPSMPIGAKPDRAMALKSWFCRDSTMSAGISPARSNRPLASTANDGGYRQDLDCPPVNGRMIEHYVLCCHHFVKMPEAQRVATPHQRTQTRIPSIVYHFKRMMQPFENTAEHFVHQFLISTRCPSQSLQP